ncbi:MAG: hypothetical protein KAY11_20975 [Ilumatobacteraceae bacterium]|nr:hypothetical protein [Acidimicrobiaceae bacterium]MBP8212047.1 hypothetical protein [Ilumatobacteraceae bacterium]
MHADLFADETGFTPRPAWQVIEAARRQMLTGELSLATAPTTHVYLRDGQVYFAERTTDGGLGVRLLVEGVITRQQMGKGALLVSGVEHLGRMFQRDSTIDRQSVELCVELMTDDVLTTVANDVIERYTMTMYKRHPNGIDRWLPNRVEVVTRIVEGSHLADPATTPIPAPAAAAPAASVVAPAAPARPTPPIAAAAPLEAATPAATVTPVDDPAPVAAVEPPAAAEPVAAAEPAHDDLPEVEASEEHAFSAAAASADDDSSIRLAQSAMDAIMSTAIADEVADAVRRALEAIDAAAQPLPSLSPTDFELTPSPSPGL